MGDLEERRNKTEGCTVKVVNDDEVRKVVDISGMVINPVEQDRINKLPTGRDSIDATDAVSIGKDGTYAVDVHGPRTLETTETTKEAEAREKAEEKRIADMPSITEDSDVKPSSDRRSESEGR